MNYTENELLKRAIEELKNLNPGEEFLVKDLFKGYEWNRFKKSVRLRLGVLFLHEVQSKPELKVKKIEKSPSNQQRYRKDTE